MLIVPFVFLVAQIGFAIYLFYFCLAFLTGGPFVPSSRTSTEAMIKLAHIRKGTNVYDLGSGDGRLVRLSRRYGARAVGFEINPILVLWANLRGAPTRWQNFWKANLSDADVVFVYLLPWKMTKLAQKLKGECRHGTLIVSNSFIFPGWHMVRQDQKNHIYAFMV